MNSTEERRHKSRDFPITMQDVSENVKNSNFWCVFYRFPLIFFAKCNLFRLRNMPTKFREVAPRRCKVIWKLVEILNMEISGAFLIGFL